MEIKRVNEKELALKIVNTFDKQHMDILEEITDVFINQARMNLENAQSFDFVNRQQGIIFAMRKMKKIREEALALLTKEKVNG